MSEPEITSWADPPIDLSLGRDELHVWRIVLDEITTNIERSHSVLLPDEKERAARFHFDKDRRHFTVARGALRHILGRYLAIEPAHLQFRYSKHGKPALAPEQRGDWLRFNLSHSGGLALIGVTTDREIGVDIEAIRSGMADEQIPERFFSAEEVRVLRALPKEVQDEAFFNCWTRKEAYIKAIGEGLSMPLHLFDVSLAPGEPAMLLRTRKNPDEATRWIVHELFPGEGFKAAVMAERKIGWTLKCWQWKW